MIFICILPLKSYQGLNLGIEVEALVIFGGTSKIRSVFLCPPRDDYYRFFSKNRQSS